MMHGMKPFGKRRIFGTRLDKIPAVVIESLPSSEPSRSRVLKTVGWVSAGLGAVALGLFVGRELRQRYKFNRRTPYDAYSHAGDEMQDVEFGVGI
jgi:hypothetical protein